MLRTFVYPLIARIRVRLPLPAVQQPLRLGHVRRVRRFLAS